MPSEVHVRIKRYSMEEVLQDSQWLDKKWAEKDRLLGHFFRHQQFPPDKRGFCCVRTFNTRWHNIESSLVGLARLSCAPFVIPLLMLVSIPLAWVIFWLWILVKISGTIFPDADGSSSASGREGINNDSSRNGVGGPRNLSNADGEDDRGSNGGETTPFVPATPFASPLSIIPLFGSK